MSTRQNGMNGTERPGTITPAQKWVNAGPDEGALHALLDRVIERVPRDRIDVLWLFPPRIAGGVESTVIVIAGFDDDAERRTVATAHFRVTRDKRGRANVALQMQEHGSAPVGATQRVVDGVLRRLGDEVARESPRRVEIGGGAEPWWALYEELGGEVPEQALEVSTGQAPEQTVEVSAEEAPEQVLAEAADETQEQAPEDAADETQEHALPDTEEPHAYFERDDGESTPPHGDPLEENVERD